MFKKLMITSLTGMMIVASPLSIAAETIPDTNEITAVVTHPAIHEILDSFVEAGLPVFNPQKISKEDLENEPFITEDMYYFGVVPTHHEQLLGATIYSVDTFAEKDQIIDFYEQLTFEVHLTAKDNLILVMDGDINAEIFDYYQQILQNPAKAKELSLKLADLIALQLKTDTRHKESSSETHRTIRRKDSSVDDLIAALIAYWKFQEENEGIYLTFNQFNNEKFMEFFAGGILTYGDGLATYDAYRQEWEYLQTLNPTERQAYIDQIYGGSYHFDPHYLPPHVFNEHTLEYEPELYNKYYGDFLNPDYNTYYQSDEYYEDYNTDPPWGGAFEEEVDFEPPYDFEVEENYDFDPVEGFEYNEALE